MARGAEAKIVVANKLMEIFGNDYIAEVDKKHYVWANDGGERVQIAISLTCPKVFIEADGSKSEGIVAGTTSGFPEVSSVVAMKRETAEISNKERETVAELMSRLGL